MTFQLRRLTAITALLCIELVTIGVAYQLLLNFECRAIGAEFACRSLRSLVARALAVLAAVLVLLWSRRASFDFLATSSARPNAKMWLLLHCAGVGLMLTPLLASGRPASDFFALAIGPWLIGATGASIGALLWLAPAEAWARWLGADRATPLVVVALAFFIPDVAELLQPAWDSSALTRATFFMVERTLYLFDASTVSDPDSYVIGLDDFLVSIAPQCSGVEGFALVTGFVLLYAYLFREQTRFPQFWLTVLPAGLALSWILNVVRIAMLILLGAYVSPELAVNGFHSYAGWMFFTLLALSLLYAVQAIPWLQTGGERGTKAPLLDDWAAACVLPFVAFMSASVVASALWPHPDLGYPLKALAMAATLAVFHRAYRRLDFAIDPLAVGAGVLVGLTWIALQPESGSDAVSLNAALAGLGSLAFVLWAALRVTGTVLLVPIVEELFFRGYVLRRLDRGGLAWRLIAIFTSTMLFAALHGRWLEAGLAGLIFALLALRRGRLFDAVAAHVAANAVVAGWALARGDWSAI